MEQKAVVYKNLKGMSRDMSVSSGNNDFSYENYNIRITTRGKEDSLIVTNEKGTESNIIASREVIKTTNTIFVGREADFLNTITAVNDSDLDKYSYLDLYRIPDNTEQNTDITIDDLIPINEFEYVTKKHYENYTRPETKPSSLEGIYYCVIDNGNVKYIQATDAEYDNDNIDLYELISIAHNFYKIETSKSEVQLSSLNDDICFGINVEYPIDKTEPNELQIKGSFEIDEASTEYLDEQITLLENGKYVDNNIALTLPIGKNNQMIRKSLKDIILGEGGSYETDNVYDAIDGVDYNQDDANIPTEDIMSNWLPTYKTLYDRLIERNFTFYGFNTTSNNFNGDSVENFSLINQGVSEYNTEFSTGEFKADDLYANGLLNEVAEEENDIPTGYFHAETNIPKLGYLNGFVFANKYPVGTNITLSDTAFYLRLPVFKKEKNGSIVSNVYSGYVQFKFDFDIDSYFVDDNTKFKTSIETISNITDDNDDMLENLTCKLNFGSYSVTSFSPVSSINVQNYKSLEVPFAYTNAVTGNMLYFGEVEDNEEGWEYKSNKYKYALRMYNGPMFPSNYEKEEYDQLNTTPSYYTFDNTYAAFQIKIFTTTGNLNTYTFKDNNFLVGDIPSLSEGVYDDDESAMIKTIDGIVFNIKTGSAFSTTKYSCVKYEIETESTTTTAIESIWSNGDETVSIKLSSGSNNNIILKYDFVDNTISLSGVKYNMYKVVSDNFATPFIFYVTAGDIDDNGKELFEFNGSSFNQISGIGNFKIINSNMTDKENIINSSNSIKIFNSDGELYIGDGTGNNLKGNITITKYTNLPIYEKDANNTTLIKSVSRRLYKYPTFDTVLNKFGFKQDKFNSKFTPSSFKLKCSNSDWDKSFKYKIIDSNPDDNDEFIKQFKPMNVLDINYISLKTLLDDDLKITGVKVNVDYNDKISFFDSTLNFNDNLHITIKDKQDNSVLESYTLEELINEDGVEIGVGDFSNKHEYYISEIFYYDTNKPTLVIDKNKMQKDIAETQLSENNIEYEMLVDNSDNTKKYIKQINKKDDFVSIMPYSFNSEDYNNKFFSKYNNAIYIPNYGEYSALKIPGRILGSCTIEEYVVLFFHYSAPALKFYKHENGVYKLLPNNSSDIKELYTYRRGSNGKIFDLAVKDGILLKNDNNDYINGKNQDYIICLKYIDARPENKDNEWVNIVSKIANAVTQEELVTEIVEKKPYYAADILYQGNLKFNANNGIETIGYYESKDVIKVYWTDGLNQPRMINVMTPNSIREGDFTKWGNKTFDFVQEIKGTENVEIIKQFGGGAFPSGSVQYYLTYSNQGGCETNPFYSSPIYYTSQSSKGNSPLKITDNTFQISISNVNTSFNYINVYSVVRSTKDSQPYCKKVVQLSMKNYYNTEKIVFTDNNLIGETIEHTYLLMLQGVPINALTFSEKDNTLFLGNINKLQKELTPDEKESIKNLVEIKESVRKYQEYNPNNEEWYENLVKNDKISLEFNSSEIKTFMYNEYYRLGIQFQDSFGKWTDPIFIKDVKCQKNITNKIIYAKSQNGDGTKDVDSLSTSIPYFLLTVKDSEEMRNIISKYNFKRIRPIIVYPNISSRNVLCQGLLNPTMFNYADRSVNGPFNFNSYYFRPYPPAIGKNNTDGTYKHDVDFDIAKGVGYPVEYRHGYPITGWHDAIEEGFAKSGIDDITNKKAEDVSQMISDYLSKQNPTKVKLTSNTPGWFVGRGTYLRNGTVEIAQNGLITCNGDFYKVKTTTNKGDIYKLETKNNAKVGSIDGVYTPNHYENKWSVNIFGFDTSTNSGTVKTSKAVGFTSHMHYYKTTGYLLASIITADMTGSISATVAAVDDHEIIKTIGDNVCILNSDCMCFNEGGVWYKASFPLKIQILPLTNVKKKRHRGLKRKTYFCDIIVESSNIEIISKNNGSDYIDDAGSENDYAKKAYFSLNNGEIQCANGNKNYNIFKGSDIESVDKTYNSSEINVAGRKQSLFYVDESVCTLNSPEIEYNPTVQKIDLSNYKLNIVGAANITGYKNKIDIDYETPPATLGSIVAEGFKHDSEEAQNFNEDAFRYKLSGGYWYDTYFFEGEEGDAEKGKDDSEILSDQYCWWVYPFNRQILNNSHEGIYGKCRTKKWVNYHYSAFSDYFGNASIDYELKDAKQIFNEYQAVNIDTIWQSDKAIYFGSCDTAYVNPVPLVGVLGGSNDPDENAYEQSLAVSPHCGFKAGSDTYTSANIADIVPFTFASSNHFVLSLAGVGRTANVFPKFYADKNLLYSVRDLVSQTSTLKIFWQLTDGDNFYYLRENPKGLDYSKNYGIVYFVDEYGVELNEEGNQSYIEWYNTAYSNTSGVGGAGITITIKLNDVTYPTVGYFNQDDIIVSEDMQDNCGIIDDKVYFIQTTRKESVKNNYNANDFETVNNRHYTLLREYNIPSSLIKDSTKPEACIENYIEFGEIQNGDERSYGIYDYGHVYIAQLERGVKSADEVFSGTEESVLLQNTWFPAGKAIGIDSFLRNGSVKYTEGDTYYQRYDCLKTYAHSSSDVNQNIEYLSAMIQTRLNLDGIYSDRGLVDNVDANNTNTNLLNQSYTQDDNYFSYSITDPYISNITEYSNMFTWTLTKQIMSSKDNWTAINLINFYNATGSFGKITKLINYRNDIFCFQNNAISKILYNERIALTPSDGVPIEIGNSGKVQGLGYISSNVGCQNRWSVVPSKSFLYWVDDRRAEIYRFGDGLEPFSTINGFSDWVKSNTYGEDWKPIKSTNVPITAYYDNNNDDIYFVTEKDCLAFNEKLNAFESFFSYEDSFILNSAGNTLVIKEQDTVIEDDSDFYTGDGTWNNGIRGDGLSSIELMHEGEYNRFFGVQMPFYVRFKVYPSDMQRDKIYTNLEFNIDAFDEKDIYLPDETFTRVRVWDEYQWGQMYLTTNPYGTTNYMRRFRNQYLQLPRASYYPIIDRYENYNCMYQREQMWLPIPTDSQISGSLSFLTERYSINDRIRNPWVWMEIYKENVGFVETEVSNKTDYLSKKNQLFLRRFMEVGPEDFYSYSTLYKFDSVYNKYDEANNNDKLAIATLVDNRENYPVSALWYISTNGEYEGKIDGEGNVVKFSKAGQDHYENTSVNLYNLQYNTLYKEEYIYCANNFNFASDATYYKLKNSNCRVEIHDIIVKYFEA